jgi:hypothetical protein
MLILLCLIIYYTVIKSFASYKKRYIIIKVRFKWLVLFHTAFVKAVTYIDLIRLINCLGLKRLITLL